MGGLSTGKAKKNTGASVKAPVLIPKIKQLAGFYIQYIADIKDHIQRDSTISDLNTAHMGPADVHLLCQLAL